MATLSPCTTCKYAVFGNRFLAGRCEYPVEQLKLPLWVKVSDAGGWNVIFPEMDADDPDECAVWEKA